MGLCGMVVHLYDPGLERLRPVLHHAREADRARGGARRGGAKEALRRAEREGWGRRGGDGGVHREVVSGQGRAESISISVGVAGLACWTANEMRL